jgi:hypothetical protein
MGTSIELYLGNVSLSYSKNYMGVDYGFLFQDSDLTRRKSESINYEYYEEHPEEKQELKLSAGAICYVIMPNIHYLNYCNLDYF